MRVELLPLVFSLFLFSHIIVASLLYTECEKSYEEEIEQRWRSIEQVTIHKNSIKHSSPTSIFLSSFVWFFITNSFQRPVYLPLLLSLLLLRRPSPPRLYFHLALVYVATLITLLSPFGCILIGCDCLFADLSYASALVTAVVALALGLVVAVKIGRVAKLTYLAASAALAAIVLSQLTPP